MVELCDGPLLLLESQAKCGDARGALVADATLTGERVWQLSCVMSYLADAVPVGQHNASSLELISRRLHAAAESFVQEVLLKSSSKAVFWDTGWAQ